MCIHYRNQAEFSAAKEEKRLLQLDAQALARVVVGYYCTSQSWRKHEIAADDEEAVDRGEEERCGEIFV